jgi:hypothetical protein
MPRYSWSQTTLNRMIRATERAGLSVSRVEIGNDGNITVHTAPPAENAAPDRRNVAHESVERPTP